MEVVLNSDIARLVLGYLRDQNLHVVSSKFCKHSPHLSEEYELIKKGLLPVSIKHDGLVQIVREYCHINSKINKTIETFPQHLRDAFGKQNLIGKVSYFLKLANKTMNPNIMNVSMKSDNINNSKKVNKRCRSQNSINSSISSLETTQIKDLPGYGSTGIKKRRISGSYCFLQDAQSATSDSSNEDVIDDVILPKCAETSASKPNENIQKIDSTLQSSNVFALNSINEPPVIIDTPKPKSSITFKTTNSNQINNLTLQTPGTSQLNSNSICTTSSLIDPNISISKIILMNSNDAGTEFNTNTGLSPFTAGEQVFIDLGTGQTFPFIMSNDGGNCMLINRTDIDPNDYQQLLLTNNTTTTELDESENQQQSLNKSVIFERQVPQSLDSKLIKENLTPDNYNTINEVKKRSLSTPRRKSSHVRVLNFSPRNTDKLSNQLSHQNVSNQPIIESVQILPKLQISQQQPIQIEEVPSPAILTQSLIDDYECSNSNSTDLIDGDHSNVTVIQRKNVDTPRRKRNLRSCKRVLSNSDDGNKRNTRNKMKISPPHKNKLTPKRNYVRKKNKIIKEDANIAKNIKDEKIDPLEEWRQMRLKTKSTNFDQHLREVASKTTSVGHFLNHSRRRKRRKIGGNISRDDDNLYHTDIDDDESPDDSYSEIRNDSNEKVEKITPKQTANKPESKNLLNFRIKTPLKINTSTKRYCGKQNAKNNKKNKSTIQNLSKNKISDTEKNQEIVIEDENNIKSCDNLNSNTVDVPKNIENTLMTTTITDQQSVPSTSYVVSSTAFSKEIEKRTANIAHLLDTPFKVESILFPITPTFIEPQISDKTPTTKLKHITPFSSVKNLDIRTPLFAITPGYSLTQADKDTPKSASLSNIQTDYSSGGSYYRPDESEDLNKELDRKLNDEMRRRRLKCSEATTKTTITNTPVPTIKNELENSTGNDNNKMNCEKSRLQITPETILPCPVILEKVKTFSDEKPNIIPHYKLSDALPELSDESTTSSSSSSPSSASSNSSTSSSSSSSSSASSKDRPKSGKSLFSVIDSSEDEEWDLQKTENIKQLDEENSQLVTNDGEVRFPVRSWITPKKPDEKLLTSTPPKLPTTSRIKIPNNSMMKIYDEKSKQKSELEQKRQRIKEQLAEDFKNKNKQCKKTLPNKSTSKSKIENCEVQIEKLPKLENIIKTTTTENRQNQIEVLTALNLEAKKKPIDQPQQKQQENSNIQPNFDDNATSEVFTSNNKIDYENSHSSAESLKIHNAALALTSLSMQQKRKITLPIEPLPMKRTIKKVLGRPKKNQNDEKSDNKIIKPKRLTTNTIKLRSETRSSPNLLQQAEKKIIKRKIPSELTMKSDKNDAIKEKKSNKIEEEIVEPQRSTIKCTNSDIQTSNQSSEIQKSKEETKLPLTLKTTEQISTKSVVEDEICQVSSAISTLKNVNLSASSEENITFDCKNTNDSDAHDNSADDFEEEDPYDSCELMKSENFLPKTILYSGSNDYCPEFLKNQYNLKNSIMNINLDGILHKLQCTEEILLFSMEPKLNEQQNTDIKKDNKRIKSKPKKCERNLKITSNSKSSGARAQETNEFLPTQNPSTPNLPKFKISHKDKGSETRKKQPLPSQITMKNLPSTSKCVSATTSVTTSKSLTKTIGDGQENLGKNIRAEDISAVLSHLHGSEEQ